jgi:hypothetical protein
LKRALYYPRVQLSSHDGLKAELAHIYAIAVCFEDVADADFGEAKRESWNVVCASEERRRTGRVPVRTFGQNRYPSTSHGLHSGTAVVGRVKSKTLGRYPSFQTRAIEVPYAFPT